MRIGIDVALISSFANVFRAEHRQLPGVGSLIVADEIRIAVCASHFEVPVVWRQPRIEHIRDRDAPVPENQRAWRLLAAVARVALDTNCEGPFLLHPITMRRWNDRSA